MIQLLKHRSQGFALVLVLMVSTILLVLSSVIVQNTSTESTIAGNERDALQVFMTAETACFYVAKKLQADGSNATPDMESLFPSSTVSDTGVAKNFFTPDTDLNIDTEDVTAVFEFETPDGEDIDLSKTNIAGQKERRQITITCSASNGILSAGVEIGVRSQF